MLCAPHGGRAWPDLPRSAASAARRREVHVAQERVVQQMQQLGDIPLNTVAEEYHGRCLGLDLAGLVVDSPGVQTNSAERRRQAAAACAYLQGERPGGGEVQPVTAE